MYNVSNYVSLNYRNISSISECVTANCIYKTTNYSGVILWVKRLIVDKHWRNKGIGLHTLYALLEQNEDKLIIIEIEYIETNYNYKCKAKDKRINIIKLVKYFERVGFKNINEYFGRDENKVSMCFKNKTYFNWINS